MRRQIITLLTLMFVLSLLFLQGTASAESRNEGSALGMGSCGAELSWVLEPDGILTISGTGPMDDYYFTKGKYAPWHDQFWNQIRRVVVSDGVTGIGNFAFEDCAYLTEVILPESVTGIGNYAFNDCAALRDICFPENLTRIGSTAFGNCDSLISVQIPDSVTELGYGAFSACDGLVSAALSPHMTKIEKRTFSHCGSLMTVIIPDSVTEICEDAFYKCENLTQVVLPPQLNRVGMNAFYGCALKYVRVPASVSSIGYMAFGNCRELTRITLLGNGTDLDSDVFSRCAVKSAGPIGGGYDYEFAWTDAIPDNAFTSCHALETVTLPKTVTGIGSRAFYYCSSLTDIGLPDGLTDIGEYAFENCGSLMDLKLPRSVTNVGDRAFAGCGVRSAGPVGSGCDLEYPWTERIPEKAFWGCKDLVSVIFPETLTDIGVFAFGQCTALKYLRIPDGIKSIGGSAFSDIAAESAGPVGSGCDYEFPWTDRIPDNAFSGCTALAEIILPETVSVIGDYAFFNCGALAGIALPEGLTEIGASAFNGCKSLVRLTIPDSVTHMGGGAFYGTAISAACQNKVDLSNVKDLIILDGALVVLRENGSVQALYGGDVRLPYSETIYDRESLRSFGSLKNVVQLADFSFAIAALSGDGSVDIVKASLDAADYSDIEAWRDIVQLSGGYQLLMGLRKDGSVEVGGDDHSEYFVREEGVLSIFEEIRTWTGMTRVLAGCCAAGQYAVGLRQDGTLCFTGIYDPYGWSNTGERIVDFDCSGWGLVAVREDGRITAAGEDAYGYGDLLQGRDYIEAVCGDTLAIGLKADGTLVSTREEDFPVGQYEGIVHLQRCFPNVGDSNTVAFRKDGSFVFLSSYLSGPVIEEAESWTGIKRVWMSPDAGFVIGLREDGTLIAAGLELEELYSDDMYLR